MTFSEQIINAMAKPSSYGEMVKLKKGRSVLFIVVMCLALAVVTFAVPTGALIASFGGFRNLFSTQLSSLEFKNGELSLEHRFTMKINDMTVIIDTNYPTVGGEALKRDGMYFSIGSRTARLTSTIGGESYEYQSLSLDIFLTEGFDCDSLIKLIPFLYVYLIITFIGTAIGFFVRYGLLALVMGLFINKINKERKLGLSFGQVFMLCYYGQTLGMIISNFNSALGLLPQMLVSIVCVMVSVRMITMSIVLLMNGGNQD